MSSFGRGTVELDSLMQTRRMFRRYLRPEGTFENSPAIYRWVDGRATNDVVPEGRLRLDSAGDFNRPSGTKEACILSAFPAVNCWAILMCPSGAETRRRTAARRFQPHCRAPRAISCRRSGAKPSRTSRSAFTLLEVILALAILAGAIAVLGEISRLALQNATAARDLSRAQILAESKLAEIQSGMISAQAVEETAFDTSSDSADPADPGWLYSISTQSTDEDGLISVRVTVTRDEPASQHPVKYSLVRWMKDPNYTYTPPTSDTSSTSSSSTSSGAGGS